MSRSRIARHHRTGTTPRQVRAAREEAGGKMTVTAIALKVCASALKFSAVQCFD